MDEIKHPSRSGNQNIDAVLKLFNLRILLDTAYQGKRFYFRML
jgi:hypothetical protein